MEIAFVWFFGALAIGVWAKNKGRSFFGWTLFSLVLSPLIGAIFVGLALKAGDAAAPKDEFGNPITPATHVHCPDCRELVRAEARKCKHCGTGLIPQHDEEPAKKPTSSKAKWGAVGLLVFVAALAAQMNRADPTSAQQPSQPVASPISDEERQASVQRLLDAEKAKADERCKNSPDQVLSIANEMLRIEDFVTVKELLDGCPTLPAQEVKALRSKLKKAEGVRDAKLNPKNFGVVIGMTPEEAIASSWGKPQSVNTTTTANGTREQWVYGGRNYLYFVNGRLTSIQN